MSSTTYPLPGEPTVLILDGEQAPYHLEREAPKWSNEDAVNYEVARDVITALMAFRSEWIGLERAKPAPDLSAIERWKAERGAYAAELRGLHIADHEKIARIRRDYGAECVRLSAGRFTKPESHPLSRG
jgi:hypothetical protein